ncbi:MAG: cytochrome c [Planctomycetaceae bacterium]
MRSHLILALGGIAASVLAGCGDSPDARFVLNARTLALAPEAQEPVENALNDNFGTPTNLVAWLRLPVNYGGSEGTVERVETDGPTDSFVAKIDGEVADPAIYPEFHWLSGAYAGNEQMPTLAHFDPETNVVSLIETLDPPPKPGDRFLINAGKTLKDGRRLYMTHCVHCHGTSGDGNGPTAKYLNPLPRDYRLGTFKFTSTVRVGQPGDKVRRDDLARIVRNGIPGTYMPSFLLLGDDETVAVVEYVRWLAMRGELEHKLDADLEGDYTIQAVAERIEGKEDPKEIFANLATLVPQTVARASKELDAAWQAAENDKHVIRPTQKRHTVEQDPDSIARGRALFLSAKAKCATCHGVTGRGDGPQTEAVQQGNDKPGLFDDWKHRVQPRDLTTGIFRGGRRPVDIYRRIRAGIKGTPMPPFGNDVLNDGEVWDLVNYVLYIPHLKGESIPAITPEVQSDEKHASN